MQNLLFFQFHFVKLAISWLKIFPWIQQFLSNFLFFKLHGKIYHLSVCLVQFDRFWVKLTIPSEHNNWHFVKFTYFCVNLPFCVIPLFVKRNKRSNKQKICIAYFVHTTWVITHPSKWHWNKMVMAFDWGSLNTFHLKFISNIFHVSAAFYIRTRYWEKFSTLV